MRATFLFYSQIDSYREMLVRFRSHKILIHLIHPRTTRIIIVRCSYFYNKRLRVISNVRNHPRRGCWSRKWIHMWLTSITVNYMFSFFSFFFFINLSFSFDNPFQKSIFSSILNLAFYAYETFTSLVHIFIFREWNAYRYSSQMDF